HSSPGPRPLPWLRIEASGPAGQTRAGQMAHSFRVMKALLDWFDRRTGYRRIIEYSLYENIPGGARWRYVWGSTLVFCLSVQFLTGLVLWMAYSPSSQTAWESVYYIQNEMNAGWLLRGIHHFTASVMNVLL